MRTRMIVASLAAAAAVVIAARADAKPHEPVHFVGPHPIASRYGGGFCYIEAPHVHVYAPDHAALYERVGDQYVFTGDPTPFGYDGDKHAFYGHHPVVTVDGEPVYCYINGPHYHAFAAPAIPDYRMDNGVAFYVGAFPPQYMKVHAQRARVVNAEYRPFVSFRPVVQVTPPPEWHGEVWVAPPAVAVGGPNVVVGGPAVEVRAGVNVVAPPPPHVSVEVSAPGVYVAPPSAGVYVGGPNVVVGGPPPVVVGGPPGHWRHEEKREWHEEHHERKEWEHEHHDNGKHKGWYK